MKQIMQKVNNIDYKYFDVEHESNNIGLMNIYYRLKLLYGSKAVFTISNIKEGGAIVTIGGYNSTKRIPNE